MLAAGVQLGTTIQAQTLAHVESSLVKHGNSIDKIADAQGSGFGRVNDNLDVIRKDVNLVRADASSLDISIKLAMECLEFLEKQNNAKDKLINNLDCHIIQLSETLTQCSSGEAVLKTLSGSGSREDPFELEGMEDKSWGINPQGDNSEAVKTDSPTLGYKLEVGMLYPREGQDMSSSGASVLPEVVERMRSLSYTGSGQGSVHSGGHP